MKTNQLKKLFLILIFAFPLFGNAQTNIDSLWTVWNNKSVPDTSRMKAMFEIAWEGYLFNNPDSAFYYASVLEDFAKSKNSKKHVSNANNLMGATFFIQGNYQQAIHYYTISKSIKVELGDIVGASAIEHNIGNIYFRQGDHSKAIESYMNCLALEEKSGNIKGIAEEFFNIGVVYSEQGDDEDILKSLEMYSKSLSYSKEIGNKELMAKAYNSMGNANLHLANYDLALKNYHESLKLSKELNNKSLLATTYSNIGNYYQDKGELIEAKSYFEESLLLWEEIGHQNGVATGYNTLGTIYINLGNHKEAIFNNKQALKVAEEIGSAKALKHAAEGLWTSYKAIEKYQLALEMHEKFISTRDTLLSEQNQKAIIQQEFKYAYEKQVAADSIKAEEAAKVSEALLAAEKAENKQHQIAAKAQSQKAYFLYGGLGLALLFGGFIFNRFRVTAKQKEIIEKQKQKVDEAFEGLEEAHKEITDSINYAERIQRSFLAADELLQENLDDYFVYFNPKEAVSGDFYWAGHLSNGNFAIVNADSTGHGVPGAIMSILNVSSIEKAVENNATNPAEIFNQTRKTIIDRLKKDGSKDGGKDGMDASLIAFNKDKTKMVYVAAQNPIWIIRDGKLTEIKPEKMPVGKHDKDNIPFSGGEYEIQKGDQIYTLTDGFQDQFGGPKGKKFMVKKMREYVLSISNLPMEDQLEKISTTFSDWKGNIEQIDDVCVIGVRI